MNAYANASNVLRLRTKQIYPMCAIALYPSRERIRVCVRAAIAPLGRAQIETQLMNVNNSACIAKMPTKCIKITNPNNFEMVAINETGNIFPCV
jgi:hypothetical protein